MAQSWKHDIGSWKSRKSEDFSSRTAAQQRAEDQLRTESSQPGNHLLRKGCTVTFANNHVLPNFNPAAVDRSLLDADVSVSELSELTRPSNGDMISAVNSTLRAEDEEDRGNTWVTVFGVQPERFVDVRDALDERCGLTMEHFWPAQSAQCNWMYVRFLSSFDAAKAVHMSPITFCLDANSSRGNRTVTVGVEWCRDLVFTRAKKANRDRSFQELNSTRLEGSSIQELSGDMLQRSSMLQRGGTQALRTSWESSEESPSIVEPSKGCISIVDAVTGSASFFRLPFLLHKRQTAEQRLMTMITATNKAYSTETSVAEVEALLSQNVGAGKVTAATTSKYAGGDERGSVAKTATVDRRGLTADRPLLIVWSSSAFRVYSNVSGLLAIVIALYFTVIMGLL